MAGEPGYRPYAPLFVLKPWAKSIWTVDGAEVRYGFGPLQVPCPTRMTVIRYGDGSLFVHSPVALSLELTADLSDLGKVAALIAPNRNHFVSLASWADAFPSADIYAAPGLAGKSGIPAHTTLTKGLSAPWLDEIDHVPLDLGTFTESVFFHRSSRTLIVTDLMMNYEGERVRSPLMRLFLRLGGATGPRGNPSIDMRMALRPHSEALKAGLEAMIALEPERLILAHGKCYEGDAVAEIERAFSDLL
ncbi:DUF4336 domain-containing protein [Erythrobacter sp.]|uniref:DUF4336 domain-containing protein n=1 Tax=Erythrobacter sp. TaxID=1042 RepID=UPI002EA7FB71|nr:DUF4336 domain-containing protein [Erythrobacter sp.]